ncbi:MAG: glycoside hydrolase family protein [Bacteroidaceae bacterium]|nr:glycoside hydrolase family protein [Bacteroidaceae bacterium]
MKIFCLTSLLCLFAISVNAGITDGREYYIINDYYDMVLGDEEGSPKVTAYDAGNDARFRFVAEKSGNYYRLRQKSSGKYLNASTGNTWSVLLSAKGSGNEFLWSLDERFGSRITSVRSQDKRLGCDLSDDKSLGVYYDKSENSRARFSVIPALSGGFESSLKAAETDVFTNAQGVKEKDDYCVTEDITLDSPLDYHIISSTPFDGGTINITNDDAWVVFDNIKPSAIGPYLRNVRINGKSASKGTTCKVVIFLAGTAVIPYKSTDVPFHGYTNESFGGDDIQLRLSDNTDLGDKSNIIRSFTLRRGYAVTLASGTKGSGYSRVYVADHSDLRVVLPKALDRRISSIYVRNWNYVSKKGYAGGNNSKWSKLNATWTYNWNCNSWSSSDVEYIPIKQHIYWPGWSDINARGGTSSAVLGYNEPEHSEQHSDDCGTTIDEWKACTHAPEFSESAMRIGSPAPTDAGWLKNYVGHVDDMAYRCDFVAYHCYWGTNEANGASGWYDRLKSVYDNTKRPIWITEWAIGASWITSYTPSSYTEYRQKLVEVIDMLERTPFIERYAYYGTDTGGKNGYMRSLFYDDGSCSPAGEAYSKIVSTFAYNAAYQPVPNWWAPAAQKPMLTGKLSDGVYTLTLENSNGDATESLVIERKTDGGEWKVVKDDTDRTTFDTTTRKYEFSGVAVGKDAFRATITTLYGGKATSDVLRVSYVVNPSCDGGTTDGWSVRNLSTNKGEAYDGDKENSYWDTWMKGLDSYMEQTVTGLPAGIYSLSALLRASETVSMELKATPGNGSQENSTRSKTVRGIGATTQTGSELFNGWMRVSLDCFEIDESGELTISISAKGPSDDYSWWSADEVSLTFLGSSDEKSTARAELIAAIESHPAPTANIGDGAFRYPTEAVAEYRQVLADALAVYNDESASLEDINAATEKVRNATYPIIRGPENGVRYNLILKYDGWGYDNKAVTYLAGDRTDMGMYNIQYLTEANANYAQAFLFTAAGNGYKLSQVDADGMERFVCTGSAYGGNASQLRTTTERDKALVVEVRPTGTDGRWNLWNTEAGNYIGSQDAGFFTVNSHIDFTIAEAQEMPGVTVPETGFATYMAPVDVTLPSGVKAFSCSGTSGTTLVLTEITTIIPADRPVILIASNGYPGKSLGYSRTNPKSATHTDGILTGVYADTRAAAGTYVLQDSSEGVKFYKVGDAEGQQPVIRANHAFLSVTASDVKAFSFDEATGVSTVVPAGLGNNDPILNLAGQRVGVDYKGIIIRNGRKQLRK